MRVSTLLCFAVALVIAGQSVAHAQKNLTPEEIAFSAIKLAKNAASRVAAAEDFVKNFPNSTRRPEAARLVAEFLPTLRNPEIARVLLERSRAIFSAGQEMVYIRPIALEIYIKSNQVDQAFKTAAEILSQKPDDYKVLVMMTRFGSTHWRQSSRRLVEESLEYGSRAIKLIEKEHKPEDVSDAIWNARGATLSSLYQQTGILELAMGNRDAAKAQILKATNLGPKDPGSYAFLGRVLNEEYDRQKALYESMPSGSSKDQEKQRLDAMVDEMIDAYARAVGLATGKVQYQALLQQVVPDLTRYYRYRNQSVTGLKQLIDKYRY